MKYATVGLVGALFAMIYLAGTTSAGLSGDDVYRAHIVAFALNHHLSLIQAIQATASQLASEHGGFFPLRQLPLWIWATHPSPEIAHIVQLVLVALNSGTFAMLVLYLSNSSSLSYIALAMLFAVIELRKPHDPILGTMFLEPQVLQFMLMAIFAWAAAVKTQMKQFTLLAMSFYVCAVLSAEWTYGFALIFPLLTRERHMRKLGMAFLLVPLFSLIVTASLHLPNLDSVRTLSIKSHTAQLPRELLTQLVGTLPTVNRAAGNLIHDGESLFAATGDTRFVRFPSASSLDVIVALGAGLCFALGLYASRKRTHNINESLLPLALGLWIFPTIIAVGASDQWRAGLPFGQAFTLVYPAFFGAALLGAMGVRSLYLRLRCNDVRAANSFMILAGLTVVFWVLGNTRANALVVHDDFLADLPRNQITQAAGDGFFDRLPAGALVALSGNYPFVYGTGTYRDADNFLYDVTKRRFVVASASELEQHARPKNAWFLRLQASLLSLKEPQLLLAHWDDSHGQVIMSRYGIGYRPYGAPDIQTAALNEFKTPIHGVRITSSSLADGALITMVERVCGPVSVQRMLQPNTPALEWNDFTPVSASTKIYMTGLMDIFHGYDPEIRTGAQRGTIIVHRDSCRKDDATFNVFAITESPAQILVRVGRVQQSFDIDQVGKMISVPLPAALPDVFRISISTNATRATELRFGPRYDHNEAADVRMVLVHPQFVNVHE